AGGCVWPSAPGLLAAWGVRPRRDGPPMTIVGGLSLDGTIPPMQGLLPIAVAARRSAAASLMFPADNFTEAGIVEDVSLFPVKSLWDAAKILSAEVPTPATRSRASPVSPASVSTDDLADVRGQ